MQETITLNFSYKELPQKIDCVLRVSTYTYQFLCTVDNTEMILEKDNDGNFRAMEASPFAGNNRKPDPGLIRALILEMERILH